MARTAEVTRAAPPSLWSESPQAEGTESLADILLLVRTLLPDALIDDRGWDRLLARTERLPPSAADAMFGFECRLDHAEASADLLLSVRPDTPFGGWLFHSAALGGPKTASLARLLCEMRRQGSPMGAAIDLVALEYDMTDADELTVPGVFLRSAAESGHADAGVLTGAIALAAGWSEKMTERNGVTRILAALPPERRRFVGRAGFRLETGGRCGFWFGVSETAAQRSCPGSAWSGDASVVEWVVSAFRACGVDNHVLAQSILPKGACRPGSAWNCPGRGAPAVAGRRRWI